MNLGLSSEAFWGKGISVLWILLTNDTEAYIPTLILLFCIYLILILIYYKQGGKAYSNLYKGRRFWF